jgi:hypothetical protein
MDTTRLIIQNGKFANDGNGDTLRDAAEKINNNFATLFSLYPGLDSDGTLLEEVIDASPSGGSTNDF